MPNKERCECHECTQARWKSSSVLTSGLAAVYEQNSLQYHMERMADGLKGLAIAEAETRAVLRKKG